MRFWSQDGPDESVLRALAERRFADFPRQEPSPRARREQPAAELDHPTPWQATTGLACTGRGAEPPAISGASGQVAQVFGTHTLGVTHRDTH
jgi:hypothetical protein